MKAKPVTMWTMVYKSIFLKKTLGTRTAAGYLRNRGFSLEHALSILKFTPIKGA